MDITEKYYEKNLAKNYLATKSVEWFDKEMALWNLEAAWNTVFKKYPKEAKEFLYKITTEVMKNEE